LLRNELAVHDVMDRQESVYRPVTKTFFTL